jgi:hypothetical protein
MDESNPINPDIVAFDNVAASRDLVKEVANWKLEARNEDNDRYFFYVREVAVIESGDRCYVIGRKGSGKTAISEYLARKEGFDVFSQKLTFKNFPFNILYQLTNDKFTMPNQYITLWKYLIYNTICKQMLKNESIDRDVRENLQSVYGDDDKTLDQNVTSWTAKEFSLGFSWLGMKIQRDTKAPVSPAAWIETVTALEQLITKHIDNSQYFIIFDELDEDYRDIIDPSQYKQYTALITSLFKAVQDIKKIFSDKAKFKILPVIFLRDDIYEIIQDSDKNKWNDFKIELSWDKEKIQKLIAFRITRAINSNTSKQLSFDQAWEKLIGKSIMRIGTGGKNQIDSFEFITRSTYLRPRDLVKYLQASAELALNGDGLIHSTTIKKVDTAFSNYLKAELIDELFAILPDITNILDTISQIGKWNFSFQEFDEAYQEQHKRNKMSSQDVGFVLQVLFLFSVIGNQLRHDYFLFRYQNREARLNFKARIVVHRGLFKSLQIR